MKRSYLVLLILFLNFNLALAKDKYIGKGQVQFDDIDIDLFSYNYIKFPAGKSPSEFWIAVENEKTIWATYWYCPNSSCANTWSSTSDNKIYCEDQAKRWYKKNQNINKEIECFIFAKRYKIVWDNGNKPENWKQSLVKSSWSKSQIKNKFKELGFYGNPVSSTTTKTEKKQTSNELKQKIVKKNEVKGEKSFALSWEGYKDLIAGIVKFVEKDYQGTLNLSLPNNDGTCSGTYSLQKEGIGTWQITCTNSMGAAGTLKWVKDGEITGIGRDFKDKKVKFSLSKSG